MENITGQKFNRLTAIKPHHKSKSMEWYWVFLCNCSNKIITRISSVKSGHTKSCGCIQKEWAKKHIACVGQPNPTHGLSYSHFYGIWEGMRSRCNNYSRINYSLYGGRGIKLEWKTFEEFRDDMHGNYLLHIQKFGRKNTQIDRIDNNGNYCKENCRWATRKEQARNTRTNHLITYKSETHCISEWAEIFGISKNLLLDRICKGWSFEKAITPLCR